MIPVFIHAPKEEGDWPAGGASRWWLHQSLAALDRSLNSRGSRLILRQGPALDSIRSLIQETSADAVYWSRRYEPASIECDSRVKSALIEDGIEVRSFCSNLLFEPWEVSNKECQPYKVFTPFWKRCLQDDPPAEPLHPPTLSAPARWPQSAPLKSLDLEPRIDWAAGMRAVWSPGEAGANERLRQFLESALAGYPDGRDRPDTEGTSRLSPHLHFGEISPRRIWHEVMAALSRPGGRGLHQGTEKFLAEVGWREFAHHILYHFPATATQPLRSEFARFPWRDDHESRCAWQMGRTGYPIVDAGMRQLWHTGWMHNRVRMIVASFLTKHLLLPWQAGAAWFWNTLVDADLASNTLGWQWTAGCGADAAPYFRIFNPVLQGEKFDPDGTYVRRWVPELRQIPADRIHKPWMASRAALADWGVRLGENYPEPIVDHSDARARALHALATISQEKAARSNKDG